MRVTAATIDIKERTAGQMLDLAFLFYRVHFFQLYVPFLIIVMPLVIAFVLTAAYLNAFWLSCVVGVSLLGSASGAVIVASSRLVFGTPMTVRDTLRVYKSHALRFTLSRALQNGVALALMPIIFGFFFRLTYALSPMVYLLENLRRSDLRVRCRGLSRRGGGSSLGFDLLLILLVLVSVVSIGSVLDLMLVNVFTMWAETGLVSSEALHDPVRLFIWSMVFVVVYPVYVLGWFFRYLDARTRAEGWDLELGFRAAASRIGEGGLQ